MSSIVAVIPARYDSVRFPGKMLADRTGKPLIQHVYEQAVKAQTLNRVIVATDDERIAKAVENFGGEVVMTRRDHPNGTSRIAEAIDHIDAEVVVNVQGDEPEIAPSLIDLTVHRLLEHSDCPVATLASPFAPSEDPSNPNVVKVVIDQQGCALYFSRSLIPYDRDRALAASSAAAEAASPAATPVFPLKHIGLYVYRRTFLKTYVELPAAPLEQLEKLEQLRVLEHGHKIAVAVAEAHFHGIDTPEQYDAFVERHQSQQATI